MTPTDFYMKHFHEGKVYVSMSYSNWQVYGLANRESQQEVNHLHHYKMTLSNNAVFLPSTVFYIKMFLPVTLMWLVFFFMQLLIYFLPQLETQK